MKHPPAYYGRKLTHILLLLLFLLRELAAANVRLAYYLIQPRRTMRPAIIAVPISLTSTPAITLLAFLITFAPDILGLDVSSDRRTLYVHTLVCHDIESFRQKVKERFEERIAAIFS